ncbi:MAG: alanine--glyoxylate aminotransferase family protein [Candidatus Omnitrophica bacterium]|nr:alanine--glyoxylate aminotransferase family protein [Candidatus Omnitrophota bacterium]
MLSRKLLMVLGPVEIEKDILEIGSFSQVYNRTDEFSARLANIFKNLQYIFQTVNPVVLTASSGTGMMEAAVTNVLSKGDKVLSVNGGTFGDRWGKICLKHGINVKEIKIPLGSSVDPLLIENELTANHNFKAVLITHNETSIGTLTDVKAIGEIVRRFPQTVLVVDCISSLVVEKLEMDRWGLDVVISGSQKALSIPPGLGFMSFSQKALTIAKGSDLRSFYFDIFDYIANWDRNQTPFTPPIVLLFQLEARLIKIKEEGLESIQERYSRNTRFLRDGLKGLGLNILASKPANCVSAVSVDDCDASDVVRMMDTEYNISIAPSGGDLKSSVFRVGNFGNIGEPEIKRFIDSLRLTLKELRRVDQ